jgi:FkbH-like protein
MGLSAVGRTTEGSAAQRALAPMHSPLIIAATFVADPLQPVLEYWGRQLGASLSLAFAPYAQIVQQLLDEHSPLATNRDGVNLLLVRCEDWIRTLDASHDAIIDDRIGQASADLVEAVRLAVTRTASPATTIVCLCPPSSEFRSGQLAAAEARLAASLAALPRTRVVGHRDVAALYPVATIYDRVADVGGHIPYTVDYFTALGTYLARAIAAAQRPPVKVLVIDCDNTLWSGICGEAGPLGVEVDRGSAELQQFLLEQARDGALLCLSSKNSEADVWEVFERNRGMLVKRSDFVAWRINWRPKSEHLTELAGELNLGIDAFAFVDDSPIECNEVQSAHPTALVLELPQDRSQLGEVLRHVWEFDRFAATTEDRERTRMYQEEVQREQVRRTSFTLAEFLDKMAIEVSVRPAEPADVPRIAQLTKRTNQFNTTTLREAESTVDRWLLDDTRSSFVVHVRDRFGDYGLVGFAGVQWGAALGVIDRFLLSCRALGRNVEHLVLAHLGQAAVDRGVPLLELSFVPTPRNEPARAFLDSLGCEATSNAEARCSYRLSAAAATQVRASGHVSGPRPASDPTVTRPSHVAAMLPPPAQLATRPRSVAAIRAAMAAPTDRTLAHPYVEPTNWLERLLADLWARVLELNTVGIDDDLFDLGASSIAFVIVSSALSEALEREAPVSLLLDAATIAQQAQALRDHRIASEPVVGALSEQDQRS